ncbi:polynucleotidyl transferase, ribonuclease H-like superfamily protein [Actinidia rufa]|uniref:Polynucleotidyl transferase, ribonuclease H-like superfamily protein n=1 Tax=Actinidia rufa TaxID=165716 RepID=A0A7J0ERA9_9ERIC|nr:polynucleotidyl transferase, ribonuclease H-like superfamily protein [Actinidia rufa]
MEAGYFEKVDELCDRYSLKGFVNVKEPVTNLLHSRYLQLNELVLEDVIWVDEVNGLRKATCHIEECKMVGIDSEWKPNYEKGSKPNKVSIMQIASEKVVFILDLIKLFEDVPDILDNCLTSILHSPRILKLGYNFQCDVKQLAHSYGELQMKISFKLTASEPFHFPYLEYAALDAAVLVHIFRHVRSYSQSAADPEGHANIEWKSYIVSHTDNSKKTKKGKKSKKPDAARAPTLCMTRREMRKTKLRMRGERRERRLAHVVHVGASSLVSRLEVDKSTSSRIRPWGPVLLKARGASRRKSLSSPKREKCLGTTLSLGNCRSCLEWRVWSVEIFKGCERPRRARSRLSGRGEILESLAPRGEIIGEASSPPSSIYPYLATIETFYYNLSFETRAKEEVVDVLIGWWGGSAGKPRRTTWLLAPLCLMWLVSNECNRRTFQGRCKATKKFRALQQQVHHVLYNSPKPGPAVFVAQCLYVVPILEAYSEGFSHLIISALRRFLKVGTTAEDFIEAKSLAALLFLFTVGGDEYLKNSGTTLEPAITFVEKFIFKLIESESYMAADYRAADKWATFMGKPMLCTLVREYSEKKLLKRAYEIIKKNNLRHEFPEIYHTYKESSLKKLAEKGIWDIAEAKTNGDKQLLGYLVAKVYSTACAKRLGGSTSLVISRIHSNWQPLVPLYKRKKIGQKIIENTPATLQPRVYCPDEVVWVHTTSGRYSTKSSWEAIRTIRDKVPLSTHYSVYNGKSS